MNLHELYLTATAEEVAEYGRYLERFITTLPMQANGQLNRALRRAAGILRREARKGADTSKIGRASCRERV